MKISIQSVKLCDDRSPWHLKEVNVSIEDGVITSIGTEQSKGQGTVIDGRGKWLTIGWFDMWAHLCDPGLEHKENLDSGRSAAVAGGFTGVAVLPNTQPVTESKSALSYITKGNEDHVVALYPLAAVTKETAGHEIAEMLDLEAHGAVAFTDGLKPVTHTDVIVKSLQYLQKVNGLFIQRPEDTDLTLYGNVHEGPVSTSLGLKGMPALAEELIIQRDLELLKYAGGKMHFANISSAGSVNLIRKAKGAGLNVTCDVTSFQLLFNDVEVLPFDTNYKVNPPFRSTDDVEALYDGIKDGTIDAIVSAHNPQDEECKKLEFDLADFGVISLQTVGANLASMSALVPLEVLLKKVTTTPREILGLEVPAIETGSLAELTLFDPREEWLFNSHSNYSKSENSPFFGQRLTGKASAVIRGKKYWYDQ
ncbi:MAG: dihydroorotase [Cyclobacteriaceae bacterium]|nr:dihydroorotase [Cyclobacteriaceae bacterium]